MSELVRTPQSTFEAVARMISPFIESFSPGTKESGKFVASATRFLQGEPQYSGQSFAGVSTAEAAHSSVKIIFIFICFSFRPRHLF